jgi:hypothetical protein
MWDFRKEGVDIIGGDLRNGLFSASLAEACEPVLDVR